MCEQLEMGAGEAKQKKIAPRLSTGYDCSNKHGEQMENWAPFFFLLITHDVNTVCLKLDISKEETVLRRKDWGSPHKEYETFHKHNVIDWSN